MLSVSRNMQSYFNDQLSSNCNRKIRCVMASANDVTWFSREIQNLLTAGASLSRRPGGLKKMRVKIVFKDDILLESFKDLFKSGNTIFRRPESFDGTRFGRQYASDFVRGHSSPSLKGNLCDTLNLFSNTLFLISSLIVRTCWIYGIGPPFLLNLGIGHFSDNGMLIRTFALRPPASQKATVVTRRTCHLTLDVIRASTQIR